MAKYTTKELTVDAVQYNSKNVGTVYSFMGRALQNNLMLRNNILSVLATVKNGEYIVKTKKRFCVVPEIKFESEYVKAKSGT